MTNVSVSFEIKRGQNIAGVTCVHQEDSPLCIFSEVTADLVGKLFSEEHCDEGLPWASIQADYSIVFKSCFKKFYLQ